MPQSRMPDSRRSFLQTASAGFGYLAFAGLSTLHASRANGFQPMFLEDEVPGKPLAPKAPHFEAKAKHVIFLCMQGGPSHIDTFDYKPQLTVDAGKSGSSARGGNRRFMPSPWKFRQQGKSGLWISELFPELGKHADELCLIRSMHCDQPIHPRAMTQMHTGNAQFVRPSLGAWTLYGLGTENESLPGYIALNPQAAAGQNYGSAFLPAIYQGTKVGRPAGPRPGGMNRGGSGGPPLPDLNNPRLQQTSQRLQIDLIQKLNQQKLRRDGEDPNVEGIIESYELAFRMQDTLPDLMDLSGESQKTLAMYGIGDNATENFGRQCLMARRFVEAGVRFIELSHGNWDHHQRLRDQLPDKCNEIDRPIAGLLADLKQRGLLDETLVIWGGEFGRTPDAQNGDGRDHNNKGYTTWMAGGGARGGFSYGATDEHGGEAIENKCHIHDWHATILHMLGLDHERLTYRYAGRNFRLTDVYGTVIRDVVA
jgi:hypothetical protein